MARDCSTCTFLGDGGKCKKGDQAEVYCMGGGYELWQSKEVEESVDELISKGSTVDTVDQEVLEESENIANFTPPEVPYGQSLEEMANTTLEEVEAKIGRPLSEAEKKHFEVVKLQAQELAQKLKSGEITEEDLQKALDPEQQRMYAAMKETLQNIENRPKTDEEGFNGVKKDGILKAPSCNGCKHDSMVGCFLGRYYDCVDNKRYLFEPISDGVKHIESIEAREERESDEKDVDFIDRMLKDKDSRTQ